MELGTTELVLTEKWLQGVSDRYDTYEALLKDVKGGLDNRASSVC